MFRTADQVSRKGVCALIRVYQYTLSPDHGLMGVFFAGQCRFRPSCSQFAYEQIRRRGLSALPSVISRIFRCR